MPRTTRSDNWGFPRWGSYGASREAVKVRPIRVEGMFDGGPSGPVLSDHNGFRVVYEISWPAGEVTPPPLCPWALGSAMVMWIVAPLGVAVWRFK